MSLYCHRFLRGAFTLFPLLIISLLVSPILRAQEIVPQLTQVDENGIDFVLDGKLDESIWRQVPYFDGMRVITPDILAQASYETHIKLFYTERGIYVGVMNYQPDGSIVARMTSRDT